MKPVNALMIKTAFQLAAKVKARAVMIHADILEDLDFKGRCR